MFRALTISLIAFVAIVPVMIGVSLFVVKGSDLIFYLSIPIAWICLPILLFKLWKPKDPTKPQFESSTEYRHFMDKLVAKAEADSKNNPGLYRRKLRLYALLGYGFIFLLITVLVGLVGGLIYMAAGNWAALLVLLKSKLIFVLIPILWILLRSLFMSVGEPHGISVTEGECPALWHEVKQLQQHLKTPDIDKILIIPDMNAAIAQIPTYGIFGPKKSILILGLELLLALSPAQARSILAHEFAHLSGNHCSFNAWIYRLRQSWVTIDNAFISHGAVGTSLIRRFFDWYAPKFQGYSYVLARDNEYEADALAAKLTSPQIMASALVTIHVFSRLVQQTFWDPLYKRAYSESNAPNDVYFQLNKFVLDKDSLDNNLIKDALSKELTVERNTDDTHPVLMDRLKALKQPGQMVRIEENAAKAWLGMKRGALLKHFNTLWINHHQDEWSNFHKNAQQAMRTIERIKKKDPKIRTKNEGWELATNVERYCINEKALPYYLQYYTENKTDIRGTHAIGRLLLAEGNERGINFLKKSCEKPSLRYEATQIIWNYYGQTGNTVEAEQWLSQLEDAYDEHTLASRERAELSEEDDFFNPKMKPEQYQEAEAIVRQIQSECNPDMVWIAEKEMNQLRDIPLFIFAVEPSKETGDPSYNASSINDRHQYSFDFYIISPRTNQKLFEKVKMENFFIR